MQVIAGEVRAIIAEIDMFGLDTLVNLARLGHIKSAYGAAFVAASFAGHLFKWNIPFQRDLSSHLYIVASEIHWTVETIKATRRSQVFEIH